MIQNISDLLSPALRFPDFVGNWELVKFSKCFKGIKKFPQKSDNYPLYSLTISDGVTPKTERYEREFLVKSVDTAYKVVEKENFVYNPMNLRFGALAKHNSDYPVLVSKYYDVFSCRDGYLADYFSNYLLTNRMIIFYNRMATGSLEEKKRLHFSDFLNFEKPVPLEKEQQKIANFLTSVDTKVQQLKRKHTLMKQYKKGVMQQLFSQQVRFKTDEGGGYPDWSEKRLGEVTKVYDGTHTTPKYTESGVPFYSVEHLTRSNFSNTKFIAEDVFEKENKRVKLEKNDILMTRIGDIGTSVHLTWDVRASFYVSLALIKSSDNFSSSFLNQFIESDGFQRELHKRIIHVAFPKKINLGEIGNCLVKLPCLAEQQKVANFLRKVDEKIQQLNTQITQAETFKKGLLQQMFV